MSIDRDTVKKVAKLARIAVDDQKADIMTGELNAILDWVEQLDEVNTDNVPPMTSVRPMQMKMRMDQVSDGDIADKVISNAPAQDDHYFMVPKVVE